MATTKTGGSLRLGRYVLIKSVAGLLTVIGVLTLTFVLVRLAPGDPAARILDVYGTPEAVANLRHQMGLDRPLQEQYFEYLGGVLTGDLGTSLQSQRSVISLIVAVFPHTVALAVARNGHRDDPGVALGCHRRSEARQLLGLRRINGRGVGNLDPPVLHGHSVPAVFHPLPALGYRRPEPGAAPST